MEYTVFKVLAERDVEQHDIDCVPNVSSEEFFSDMFSSRKKAIRKAQKIFAKNICFVRVIKLIISEKGTKQCGVIYRKYDH